MKAFLVTVSSLCFCGILLCFFAYATNRLPMPKTQHPVVLTIPQQIVTQKPTMEEASPCSPCVERLASILEVMEQEWEGDRTSFLEESALPLDQKARGWDGLSPEQREPPGRSKLDEEPSTR